MDFYTSDTHYFHKNVILYCSRPFLDVARWVELPYEERKVLWDALPAQVKDDALREMHETMIRLWNERVGHTDHVFHLGDFAFGLKEEQTKILKRLNGTKWLVKGNHDGSRQRMLDTGFKEVFFDGFHTDSELGIPVYVRHKPNFDYQQVPFADEDTFHLCGHVHEVWARKGNVINVGVDQSWFAPLTLQELLNRPYAEE